MDLEDLLPRSLLLALLRGLWWLGWEFGVQTVGWGLGWLCWRILSLGRFPPEGLGEVDAAPWPRALLIELSGLALLAAGIAWLAADWPPF